MTLRPITDTFSVAPQISTAELAALKGQGIRALICNRPDGEAADQPRFAEIADAAHRLGMQVRYIPITGAPVAQEDVTAFRAALAEMPEPVLAYCRSGTRSALLWALAQSGRMAMQDILRLTAAAGYDLAEPVAASLMAAEQGAQDRSAGKTRTGT